MPYKNPHLLLTTEELDGRLGDQNLVLIDLRPPEEYANGHIPTARSLDIFGISLIDTRDEPLIAFLWIIEHLIAGKGVCSNSSVVLYDRISGERAARLFWFLEFFGHEKVHVLNGGFNAWVKAGFPVGRDAIIPERGDFEATQQSEKLATASYILDRLDHQSTAIVDTRSTAEYNGTLVRSARKGRIPGAIHLEWKNNLNKDGTFKTSESLTDQYCKIGITPDREVIPYCQGGYRSANTYLALRLLGYPHLRNYLGSWGEWGNRTELPIEDPERPK